MPDDELICRRCQCGCATTEDVCWNCGADTSTRPPLLFSGYEIRPAGDLGV